MAENTLWVRAKPSAAAMKGAVQGAATATANTPVKKAPIGPDRCARLSPKVTEPTSKHAGKIETHSENQQRKTRHGDRLLQLKTPAHRVTTLA